MPEPADCGGDGEQRPVWLGSNGGETPLSQALRPLSTLPSVRTPVVRALGAPSLFAALIGDRTSKRTCTVSMPSIVSNACYSHIQSYYFTHNAPFVRGRCAGQISVRPSFFWCQLRNIQSQKIRGSIVVRLICGCPHGNLMV